ncbi:SBP (S-ribonuclease binding protein) family protein [Striga hermonthica]|uniref:SBP (S-ribonuclease binding protein) family protein n=1 Tax=Striga hermonthica TaxID=68872 RepID=A0A9N7NA50_STRHE|nr:SBP (S-ribonuclease binding protein) family protein [Striga hermonthica]
MVFRKMLGNVKFSGSMVDDRTQLDNARLTELQFIRQVPIQPGTAIAAGNYVANEQPHTASRPIKRLREGELVNAPQKLRVSLHHNDNQDKHGHIGASPNANLMSTGLKLFSEKKELSSSVSSTYENIRNALPGVLSLGNSITMEIDRQTEEFCQYIKLQEENILKGGQDLYQRQMISLFNALEKAAGKKLHEKELQIDNINRKNKELEDRIKQVTIEAHSWHNKAKYNESIANVLKNNIHQLMAQGTNAHNREGFGDSEVDDAISCMKPPETVGDCGEKRELENKRLKCRACKSRQVSVLLFPCRHLCLCMDCEGLVDACPVCQVMKTSSFLVYM